MICVDGLYKSFGDREILSNICLNIGGGTVYGLVGTNGAGKSTLLRILAGIYKADKGSVTLDGERIYDSPRAKSRIVIVPDEPYFLPKSDLSRMLELYRTVYPKTDAVKFCEYAKALGLELDRPIREFSKGMKRQAATVLALAAGADCMLFDETFDGLDPAVRTKVKNMICEAAAERNATAVLTSHSLRELEGTCDKLAMLHNGKTVLEGDVESAKTKYVKVQIGFSDSFGENRFDEIGHYAYSQFGSVATMILTEDAERSLEKLKAMDPVLLDEYPLTLDEIFRLELEKLGYDF